MKNTKKNSQNNYIIDILLNYRIRKDLSKIIVS